MVARTKNAKIRGDAPVGRQEVIYRDDSSHENEDSEKTLSESVESKDDTQEVSLERHLEMYFPASEYTKAFKISAKCSIKETVGLLECHLTTKEMAWFLTHPQFKHIIHMPKSSNHKLMALWMLLLRTAKLNKKKECWFIVNGVPIRYSLTEMALISGLYCHNYPTNKDSFGGMEFIGRYFGVGATITINDVKAKLLSMKEPSNDRLKMALLYFLCSVLIGRKKGGKQATGVHPFFLRAIEDLDGCITYPWGREAFEENLKDIFHTMDHFNGVVSLQWVFPSFIIPLEYLAFEAIPVLKENYIDVVSDAHKRCPRMCKIKFKTGRLKGYALSDINVKIGTTKDIKSILTPSSRERRMLRDIMDDDNGWNDEDDGMADGWTRYILEEKKIVWSKSLYHEDVTARGLVSDVVDGEDDDVMGFSGVVPDLPLRMGVADASETRHVGAADASETWRNDLLELKGQMDKNFSEINLKLEDLSTRVKGCEQALNLEREQKNFNFYYPDVNPVGTGVQEADKSVESVPNTPKEVQLGATEATDKNEKTGEEGDVDEEAEDETMGEDVQPGGTEATDKNEKTDKQAEDDAEVQLGATEAAGGEVQLGATEAAGGEVQLGATEAAGGEVQLGATEAAGGEVQLGATEAAGGEVQLGAISSSSLEKNDEQPYPEASISSSSLAIVPYVDATEILEEAQQSEEEEPGATEAEKDAPLEVPPEASSEVSAEKVDAAKGYKRYERVGKRKRVDDVPRSPIETRHRKKTVVKVEKKN